MRRRKPVFKWQRDGYFRLVLLRYDAALDLYYHAGWVERDPFRYKAWRACRYGSYGNLLVFNAPLMNQAKLASSCTLRID